jgi:GNAT superfamily N-acetyltransferase
MNGNFRTATLNDIRSMHVVRTAVKENRLPDPSRITEEMYADYLTKRGKGWVYEMGGRVVGFAIVDVSDHSVWALFVHPDHEGKGIGRCLHDEMLRWYFQQTQMTLKLSTWPGTRAESFYIKAGWKVVGIKGNESVLK